MRIDANGNVGIATNNPRGLLDVSGRAVISMVNIVNQETEMAQGAIVTKSAGTIYGGGPTAHGGTDSYWSTSTFPSSITLDFGSTLPNMASLSFTSHYNWDARFAPSGYSVDCSTDNSTWTNSGTVTGNTSASMYQFLKNCSSFRYLRITVTAPQTGYSYVNISGIQVTGQIYSGRPSTPFSYNSQGNAVLMGGYVGIGNVNPGYVLDVTGVARFTGGYTTSDQRYKKNIEDMDHSLDKVLSLRGVTYDFRTNEFPEKKFQDGKQVGLIAQEVERIIPEVVDTDKQGYKSVNYQALVAPLINAIKEFYSEWSQDSREIRRELAGKADSFETDQKIQKLEQENLELKKKNAEIEAQLKEIRTKLGM